MGPLAVLR